jgi:N-acyl-D-aspartate/D-glutamate deacylase
MKTGGENPTALIIEQAAAEIAPKKSRHPAVQTPEQKARDEKRQRDKKRRHELAREKEKRDAEERARKRREAWEQNIVAVRSPEQGHGGTEVVGRDIDEAVDLVLRQDPDRGDVALFRAGRLVAVVPFVDGKAVFGILASARGLNP